MVFVVGLPQAVDFMGLAAAIWLGVYLVPRNPLRPLCWLTGLVLWSVGGVFPNELLALYPPSVSS